MKITSTVTAIGAHAISKKDAMIILFGDSATDALRDVSVIQEFDQPDKAKKMVLKHGDHLYIDDIKYRVNGVGKLTNANLQQIGHATLIFKPMPDRDALGNAIYLIPTAIPTFKVGTVIRYETED